MNEQPFQFFIAGTQFRPTSCQAEVITAQPGTELELRREPDNTYDRHAIAMHSQRTSAHLGYVPRHIAAELAPLLDSGESFRAVVNKNSGRRACEVIVDRTDSVNWWKLSEEWERRKSAIMGSTS